MAVGFFVIVSFLGFLFGWFFFLGGAGFGFGFGGGGEGLVTFHCFK